MGRAARRALVIEYLLLLSPGGHYRIYSFAVSGRLQVRNPIPLKICRVWGLLHAKLYVVTKPSRWCGAEVWRGRWQLRRRPRHLTVVQNCEVRSKIALVLLQKRDVNTELLLPDNHVSHCSVEVLDYFKGSGVTLLTFSPHCRHKFKPLVRCVYGPLKQFIKTACDSWMSHNRRPLTLSDIPSILATALLLATIPINIKSGYRVTGIYPLNTEIFQNADFMTSFLTDRPAPTEYNPLPQTPTHTFGSSTLVALGPVSPISPAIACTVAGTCATKTFPTPDDAKLLKKLVSGKAVTNVGIKGKHQF
ncbi:hypothetical protein AVEN_39418-1 [Araneus ventricosus]|uniref:DDE-1 domain-containing protein n=1 Tax=Araneus ventricosus TaxID=182803 RepID=A0A4Y2XBB1_ARAVE|nr:hypothetical protein AVEN_39418-1 [Araneus ventricosus]